MLIAVLQDQKVMEPLASNKAISVQKFSGINQRAKFGRGELGEFDSLLGLYSPNIGMLHQVEGKDFLQFLATAGPIRGLHQTNDSRQNIIIQGRDGVYIMSEAELFNRPLVTNLVGVPLTEEEDMSQAILVHTGASGGGGAGGTTAGVFVTAPINNILSQVNPDGTAAAFVTSLVANVFTLAAGKYRIRGWSVGADNAAGVRQFCRLKINGGAALWAGLLNENSQEVLTNRANTNVKMEFGGFYNAAVPTAIIMEQKSTNTLAANGLGFDEALAGTNNIWRWIEILRTGP